MKFNITPGPWRVLQDETITIRTPGGRIATATHLSKTGRRNIKEVEANAQAIATVPDMIEALEMFVQLADMIESYGAMHAEEDWRKVKYVRGHAIEALRKAGGQND